MTNKNIHLNTYALTLVYARPDQCRLNSMASKLAQIDGIEIISQEILSAGKAVEWQIKGVLNHIDLRKQLDDLWGDFKADYCLQNAENRKKKLLVCDMDSTLIGQECIDELAHFAGVGDKVAKITERAMRGELDFEQALDERVFMLKSLPISILEQCFTQRISLNKGAKTLCQTMKKHGAITVIVSGGFTFFTDRIAKLAGFEHHHANQLLHDGENLLGEVARPILGKDAKKTTLIEYSKKCGGLDSALAIGDGANDLEMIKAAGLGIAYKAKPIVAKASSCAINHTDLTTALYFQGYKESDFVALDE